MDRAVIEKFVLEQEYEKFDNSLIQKYAELSIYDKQQMLSVAYDLCINQKLQDSLLTVKAATKFRASLKNIGYRNMAIARKKAIMDQIDHQDDQSKPPFFNEEPSKSDENTTPSALHDCFDYIKINISKRYPIESSIFNMMNGLVTLKPDKSKKVSYIIRRNSPLHSRSLDEDDPSLSKSKKAIADSLMALSKMKKSVENTHSRLNHIFSRAELALIGQMLAAHLSYI